MRALAPLLFFLGMSPAFSNTPPSVSEFKSFWSKEKTTHKEWFSDRNRTNVTESENQRKTWFRKEMERLTQIEDPSFREELKIIISEEDKRRTMATLQIAKTLNEYLMAGLNSMEKDKTKERELFSKGMNLAENSRTQLSTHLTTSRSNVDLAIREILTKEHARQSQEYPGLDVLFEEDIQIEPDGPTSPLTPLNDINGKKLSFYMQKKVGDTFQRASKQETDQLLPLFFNLLSEKDSPLLSVNTSSEIVFDNKVVFRPEYVTMVNGKLQPLSQAEIDELNLRLASYVDEILVRRRTITQRVLQKDEQEKRRAKWGEKVNRLKSHLSKGGGK